MDDIAEQDPWVCDLFARQVFLWQVYLGSLDQKHEILLFKHWHTMFWTGRLVKETLVRDKICTWLEKMKGAGETARDFK